MRDEMNSDTHLSLHSPTQPNSKRLPPKMNTQNQKYQHHFKKKGNQVMNDLPFVRVEVRLHTHVVGYLVAEASS